jgi:hypothetical protein
VQSGSSYFLWGAGGHLFGPVDAGVAGAIGAQADIVYTLTIIRMSESGAHLLGPDRPQEDSDARSMLVPSLTLGNDADILAVHHAAYGTSSELRIYQAGERQSDLPPEAAFNLDDVSALIRLEYNVASTTPASVIDRVWAELDRRNAVLYASDLSRITKAFSAPPLAVNIDGLREHIAKLQQIRAEYAFFALAIARIDSAASTSNVQPQTVMRALDGIASSMLVYQIDILNRSNEVARKASEKHERVAARRDRALVVAATIFLLPSLWFSFLGSNVFPERPFGLSIQSDNSIIAAVAVAAALSLITYVGVRMLLTKKVEKND